MIYRNHLLLVVDDLASQPRRTNSCCFDNRQRKTPFRGLWRNDQLNASMLLRVLVPRLVDMPQMIWSSSKRRSRRRGSRPGLLQPKIGREQELSPLLPCEMIHIFALLPCEMIHPAPFPWSIQSMGCHSSACSQMFLRVAWRIAGCVLESRACGPYSWHDSPDR